MSLGRILVAANASAQSDHGLRIGTLLAGMAGGSLAVVRVCEPGCVSTPGPASAPEATGASPLVFRRAGVAGIEIARCAEQWRADLVVLGRSTRLASKLGTTTEMVLRRHHGQTLLVPMSVTGFGRILYALDGSERGLRILDDGADLPAITGATPMTICVLPSDSVQASPGGDWPHPRRTRVESAMARRPELGGPESLAMRWGAPVAEVLRHLVETQVDLLVLGVRQGGPGGDPGSGHIALDLLRSAPTAILTIPI